MTEPPTPPVDPTPPAPPAPKDTPPAPTPPAPKEGNALDQFAHALAELPKTVRAEIDNALDERMKVEPPTPPAPPADPNNPPPPDPNDPNKPPTGDDPPRKKSWMEKMGF
jgi:hypothetical protein